MTGVIDVGGGMRDIYGAGVFDRLLDDGVWFDYCIGVSAGSANLSSYLARQREMQMRAMQAQQVPPQMPSKQMRTANPQKAGQQGQPTQGNPTVRRGAQRRPDMYQNQNRSDRR